MSRCLALSTAALLAALCPGPVYSSIFLNPGGHTPLGTAPGSPHEEVNITADWSLARSSSEKNVNSSEKNVSSPSTTAPVVQRLDKAALQRLDTQNKESKDFEETPLTPSTYLPFGHVSEITSGVSTPEDVAARAPSSPSATFRGDARYSLHYRVTPFMRSLKHQIYENGFVYLTPEQITNEVLAPLGALPKTVMNYLGRVCDDTPIHNIPVMKFRRMGGVRFAFRKDLSVERDDENEQVLDGLCPVRAPICSFYPSTDLDGGAIKGGALYYQLPRYFNRLPPSYESAAQPVQRAYAALFHYFTKGADDIGVVPGTDASSADYLMDFKPMRNSQPGNDTERDGKQPSPEGIHQDGGLWTMIAFIGRKNVTPDSSESRIWTKAQPAGPYNETKTPVSDLPAGSSCAPGQHWKRQYAFCDGEFLYQVTEESINHIEQTIQKKAETAQLAGSPYNSGDHRWSYENLLLNKRLTQKGETVILLDRNVKHEGRDFMALDPRLEASREILTINIRQPYTKEYGSATAAQPDYVEKGADMLGVIRRGEWTRDSGLTGIMYENVMVADAQTEVVVDRGGLAGEESTMTVLEQAYAESKREVARADELFETQKSSF